MTLKEVLESFTYVLNVWVNAQGVYYFNDPFLEGFEIKTREEIINPII